MHLRFDYERENLPLSAHIVPMFFGSANFVLSGATSVSRGTQSKDKVQKMFILRKVS